MTQITVDISMSLDGYVAGPNPTLEEPLGENGMQLHEWVFNLASWREPHGLEGGDHGPDDDLMRRGIESSGATVMGRRMFSGGAGPWEDDPNANAWWGDAPPFKHPVFILTHHPREAVTFANGTSFNFVTDGIEAAIAGAREAAGELNVGIGGGASVIQQALAAGLVDELRLHVAPVLLGGGTKLFENLEPAQLAAPEVISSPKVTHLTYRL
jgi:dihydrofolate reductase